ncbi:MAG: replication-relaxation family protein [Ardenticatenaceae bacterium]|nr:replication-relaxation family protein [Ardenticatenaceae bacterium]
MPKRRRPFTRQKQPRRLVITENTEQVMTAVHAFEGIMSHAQIVRLCFPGCTSTWPFERMQHYFDHRLIKKFDAYNVNGQPLGKIVYTLDKAGAGIAARKKGIDWAEFKWRRNPRWLTLVHDLTINDFRMDIREACQANPQFSVKRWISECELSQTNPRIPGRLDSFFILQREVGAQTRQVEQLALHLEIDTGNHSLNRFIKRKVKPILRYFGSEKYFNQFGIRDGVCLIVTNSEKRLFNLKQAIEENRGEGLFYLTTSTAVSAQTVLKKPIWFLAGSDYVFSLENMPLSPVEAGVLNDVASTRYRQALLPI